MQWELRDGWLRESNEDLRCEAVLAELLLSGVGDEDFLEWPNGGFGRVVNRDVERIHPPGATEWATSRAVVELNRPGLYDHLPEGLFLQMRRTNPFIGADEAVEEVHRNNVVEQAARKFFLPLDHEFLHIRLLVELNEQRQATELIKGDRRGGIARFWDPPASLSGKALGGLLMLLPEMHGIVGSEEAVARVLAELLRVPVRLAYAFVERVFDAGDAKPPPLDAAKLGLDTILGGDARLTERVLRLVIGPVGPDVADRFAPGQLGRRQVSELMQYLVAADQRWELDILVAAEEEATYLGRNGVYRRLGVSTVLN